MAVTTIYSNKESKLSSILIYVLGILGVGLVVFFGGQILENIGNVKGKAGLSVESLYGQAEVLVDGTKVGDTPVSSKEIKPGTRTIVVKNQNRQYQTSLSFLPSNNGTLHIVGIIRDLGVSDLFSAGQEFWFEKDSSGNSLRIISEPTGAKVYIDKSEVGTTPFSSSNVSAGNYEVKISYPGYESQVANISVQKGYTLNGNIKLFPYPLPESPKLFEQSPGLYDLSIDNTTASSDTDSLAKALVYWNTTRGINIDGVTGKKEQFFDYFIDYKGNVYDKDGNSVSGQEGMAKLTNLKNGGYLGRVSDGTGLTKEAKEVLALLTGKVVGTSTATIGTTPTGWLRVRDRAGLNGAELAKVKPGEKYSVLEEKTGWVKIKVSDTVSGWVSADYVTLAK